MGAQCNRQYQKKYFTDGTKDDLHMKHPITHQPIYYISDPSHMIKKSHRAYPVEIEMYLKLSTILIEKYL